MDERPPLVTPAFALVWVLTFLTFFAAFQLFPTVPLRLMELGASRAESGWFMTVFTTGSAFGALVGGFVVGILVETSTLLGVPTELKAAPALFILIVILLVRPQGILGRAQRVG